MSRVILYLTSITLLLTACKEDCVTNVPTANDREQYCEDGSKCRKGATCMENECKCPEDSYFLGKYQEEGENVCPELNGSFYILEDSFGYSESFEYLKAARITPVQPDFFPDTVRIELYPTEYEQNHYKLPITLDLEVTDTVPPSGGGLIIGNKPKGLAPYPFYNIGVKIPDKQLVEIAWNLKVTQDSFIISAEMFPIQTQEESKSMKLVYLPY